MHIGIVSTGGFHHTGQECVIPAFLDLVARLAERHQVEVYTLYQSVKPAGFTLCGAQVHHLGYRPDRRIPFRQTALAVRAIAARHRYSPFDILHGLWANESGFAVAVAGRMLRIPTVVTVNGGELVALPSIGYGGQLRLYSRWMVSRALRLASAVTTASNSMLGCLRARRADANRIIFGVDCHRFAPGASRPNRNGFRLAHIASLNRVKDQTTLLHAFALMHRLEPETHLEIIGVDTLNGEIQRLARDLGLQEAVTFHGFQPASVVAELLPRCDLLMHSSLSEVAPVTFLEAAACRTPTVGTAVGLIADCAPEAAVAAPIKNAEALGGAALALLMDNRRRETIARSARAFACRHDADATAYQFEDLYQRICV